MHFTSLNESLSLTKLTVIYSIAKEKGEANSPAHGPIRIYGTNNETLKSQTLRFTNMETNVFGVCVSHMYFACLYTESKSLHEIF